jgi:hypothetical protein
MTTVRTSLNKANPGSIAMDLQRLGFGEALNLLPKTVKGTVTSNKLTLPENARAQRIHMAYGVGTSSGYKLPRAVGDATAPSAGECTIDAAGNIVFNGTDAITSATVHYTSVEGEIFEETIDVASNAGTLLGSRRAITLLSATRVTGGATGAATPVQRGATPTTGQAAIGAADDSLIAFAGADAVTRATVRYVAIPGQGNTTYSSVAAGLDADLPIV